MWTSFEIMAPKYVFYPVGAQALRKRLYYTTLLLLSRWYRCSKYFLGESYRNISLSLLLSKIRSAHTAASVRPSVVLLCPRFGKRWRAATVAGMDFIFLDQLTTVASPFRPSSSSRFYARAHLTHHRRRRRVRRKTDLWFLTEALIDTKLQIFS